MVLTEGQIITSTYTFLISGTCVSEPLLVHTGDLKELATSMDVAKYLKDLKLEEYTALFIKEEVDGKLLWEMCHAKEDELQDLGVTNAFHRRKIKGKLEDYLTKLQ